MIKLKALSLSKRFLYDWVIDSFSYEFESGKTYGIIGPNGSGKSTLLQLLCGKMLPSSGKIELYIDQKKINQYDQYQYLSYAAPYVDLINEFTLLEMVNFHYHFKSSFSGVRKGDVIGIMGLEAHQNKRIAQFSSGMKQRCKLALAFLSNTPVIYIDEPGTNLDEQGKSWYHKLVSDYSKDKLVIIASNERRDISFCDRQISIAG